MIAFHREMIRLHRSYEALKTGSLVLLDGGQGYISYGRFDETDKILVAVNNRAEEITITINAWEIGLTDADTLVRIAQTDENGYQMDAKMYHLKDGILTLALKPVSAVVIKNMADGAENESSTFF